MSKILKEKTHEWMNLERATNALQRKIAEKYYEKELFHLIIKDYIARNKKKVFEKVDYLIMSVGTSYEPLVLNIALLKPYKILFLYTEKSEVIIDKILEHCDLTSSQIQKVLVDEINPLDMYRQIKDVYLKWKMPKKIYIDFTGGTKAMSAAAAMVGAVIDIQLIYVGSSEYLTDFRKPNPGSEELFYINNPYVVFGDFEIENAMGLFGECNYAGARERLYELRRKIPDLVIRQQLNFAYLLANVYEQWDALEFSKAYESIQELNMELMRDYYVNPTYLLMDYVEEIKEQMNILGALANIEHLLTKKRQMEVVSDLSSIMPLMFTMQTNALIREKQEKYDSATLLLYRLLEIIEQRRLAQYGIDVGQADFNNINYAESQTPHIAKLEKEKRLEFYKEEVYKVKQKVFSKNVTSYMPEQISLLDGFIHLVALRDPILVTETEDGILRLKQLRAVVYLRNNSIFAHGFSPVAKCDYHKFKTYVLNLFKTLCNIEGINYEKYCNSMEWINPVVSKNYNMGIKPCQ